MGAHKYSQTWMGIGSEMNVMDVCLVLLCIKDCKIFAMNQELCGRKCVKGNDVVKFENINKTSF